jgi:hypothetical protein
MTLQEALVLSEALSQYIDNQPHEDDLSIAEVARIRIAERLRDQADGITVDKLRDKM